MTKEIFKKNMPVKFLPKKKTSNLAIGLVGLPNVGKSHFFNLLTQQTVPSSNFPFCTKDPNIGRVQRKDVIYDELVKLYNPKNKIPAYFNMIDIAGLIKDASENAGLGNAFLDNILNVDSIFQIVRTFEDKKIQQVDNSVDPVRDICTINNELRMKDLQMMRKYIERFEKENRCSKDKKITVKRQVLEKILKVLEFGFINHQWHLKKIEDQSLLTYSNEEMAIINEMRFLTTKEIIYVANMKDSFYENKKANKHLKNLIEFTKKHGNKLLCFSYSHINDLIIETAFQSLNLMAFYTVGRDEVRAWTCSKGTSPPEAGGIIHSDFRDFFISADIFNTGDMFPKLSEGEFTEILNESKLKSKGLVKSKGKTYEVQPGDVVFFKFKAQKTRHKK